MRTSICALLGVWLSLTASVGRPASAHTAQNACGCQRACAGGEVSIPNTQRLDFVSRVNGHRYSISLFRPFEAPPAGGYAVLYVIDGDRYFASAVEATAGLGFSPGVVVVGLGYPHDVAYVRTELARRGPAPRIMQSRPPFEIVVELERDYDLTLPADEAYLARFSDLGSPNFRTTNVGGVDEFLATLEREVKPRVAKLVPVDAARQALFGHSFGGLAALHALLTEPNAFQTFIVASPSIWWKDRAVLADEAKFTAMIVSGLAHPRVLVTMGSEESVPPEESQQGERVSGAVAALVREERMVQNGRELVERLKVLRGREGYEVADYAVFDKLGHGMAVWPALARGISFAFADSR